MKIISLVTFFPSYYLHLQLERPNRYWWKVKREKERVRKARKLSLHFVLETEHCCFLYRKCWNRKSLIRFMTYSNYSIRLRSVHKSCGTQDIIESFRRPCQAPFFVYVFLCMDVWCVYAERNGTIFCVAGGGGTFLREFSMGRFWGQFSGG